MLQLCTHQGLKNGSYRVEGFPPLRGYFAGVCAHPWLFYWYTTSVSTLDIYTDTIDITYDVTFTCWCDLEYTFFALLIIGIPTL